MGTTKEKRSKSTKLKVFLAVIIILVAARIALPYIVLHYANKSLAGMDGYFGHINDIDIALYRGAYQLKDFYIDKIDSAALKRYPFISSGHIDLSVEWRSLFHGRLVGELEFTDAFMRFTKDKVEPGQIAEDSSDFRKILDDFMPLKINRFEIHKGKVIYIDSTSTPIVNLHMDNTHVLAQNLSSVRDTAVLPASVDATADLYRGNLDFKMRLDPLADEPTFDINTQLTNTYLPELNNFFKAYGKMDVSGGEFGMYTEIAAKNGKFKGYVKPVIKDLDVIGPEDRHDTFLNRLWEHVVAGAGFILNNRKKDQIATKVEFEGNTKDMNVNSWDAVAYLLRNAFIHALYPSLDYQISIKSVNAKTEEDKRTFIQKVFSNPEKEKKRRERREERKENRKKNKSEKKSEST